MNVTDASKLMMPAYFAGDTVLLSGQHGIGKSESVANFAKEQDFHIETLFLSHQEVGDLIGMPRTISKKIGTEFVTIINEQTGQPETVEQDVFDELTAWTKPIWLQRMELAAAKGKRCVLFLDELNRAPSDVRQTALQLVLEREIHEHSLPLVDGKKALIVAAVNPADDGNYQTEELDPALLDRFLFVEVEADTNSWLSWARDNKVNPVVREFIADNRTLLHMMPKDGGVGPTPRSWAMLGKYIDNKDMITEDMMDAIIIGKLGRHVGAQFASFLKNYVNVVKLADVENLIEKLFSKTKDIEKIGDAVAELLEQQEAPQKTELVHQMVEKYLDDKTDQTQLEKYKILGLLYSLELEILNTFLKSYRASSNKQYKHLALIDKEINDKELFNKIVVYVQKAKQEN